MSNCDIIFSPIKFLGATVLSLNSNLGLGSSESTLKVDLVEDCEAGDNFLPKTGGIFVGAPVYLKAGQFAFGGVLTGWSATQGGSGRTFSADVADPRQLLANTVIIIDSYLGPPAQAINYFNVYNEIEGQVLSGNCGVFGLSNSNERGMPYSNIINALKQMNPTIYSPTGYSFTINFNSFPQGVPEYYRVPGPSITVLQLLEDICDVLGYEFYVDLLPGAIINIGLINLKAPPGSFSNIISAFDGKATELTYGQELRNEITKTVLFGEKQHYLTMVTNFNNFFGEDLINGQFVPVVPIGHDDCGFWINKKIDSLNAMLNNPIGGPDSVYAIHELDIRCAMSSMEMWMIRTFEKEFENMNGTLNQAIQNAFPNAKTSIRDAIDNFGLGISPPDIALNPTKAKKSAQKTEQFTLIDLEIIYNWLKNLGNTYYGKQYLGSLNQSICYYQLDNSPTAEKFFSDTPTKDGGWVEDGVSVLGLSDPELGLFREDDNRIGAFAVFNDTGTFEIAEPNKPGGTYQPPEGSVYTGDVNIPTNPIV